MQIKYIIKMYDGLLSKVKWYLLLQGTSLQVAKNKNKKHSQKKPSPKLNYINLNSVQWVQFGLVCSSPSVYPESSSKASVESSQKHSSSAGENTLTEP